MPIVDTRRGLRDRLLVADTERADPLVVSTVGQGDFVQGYTSGAQGLRANRLGADALAAEAAGDMPRAQALRAQYEVEAQRAAAVAPRVAQFTDIRGAGDAVDWFQGAAGQGLASAAPVLAGAVAGRFLGGRGGMALGGAIPGYNLMQEEAAAGLSNDADVRARMTPQEILDTSRAQGAVGGALEILGPGAAIERLVGKQAAKRTLRSAAKDVAVASAAEGLTEGAQDLSGQTFANAAGGRDLTNVDLTQTLNAVAAGAAGGTAFGTPGAVVDASTAAGRMVKDKLQQGAQAVGDTAAKATQTVTDLGSNVVDQAAPIRDRVVATAKKYGTFDGMVGRTPPAEVVAQGQDAVMSWMEQNDTDTRNQVLERLQSASTDPTRPEWLRARTGELLQAVSESDDPRMAASAATLFRQADELGAKAERLKSMVTDTADFAKGFVQGPKKNAQMDAGTQRIVSTLSTASGELGQTPEFQEAAPVFAQFFTGKLAKAAQPRVAREFLEVFGDNAGSVAADMADALARDTGADSTKVLGRIQSLLGDADMRRAARTQAVQDYLGNDAMLEFEQQLGRAATPADFSRYASLIADYVDGSMSDRDEKRIVPELKKDFGENYQRVINLFTALHSKEAQRSSLDYMSEAPEDADTEGLNYEDYDAKTQAQSFETMMSGKGQQFSLAGKTNADGVAKFFDSRETAQQRFDENISPKYQGVQGATIRADEYVTMNGLDPLKFAAQYDERFKTEPADFKQRAQLAKEAIGVLRNKFAILMEPATNADSDSFSDADVRDIISKSRLQAEPAALGEKKAGYAYFTDKDGKRFKRREKPTAAEGYLFVGDTPVKTQHLMYAMRGKQMKESFGGTADQTAGAPAKLRTLMAALARLGDSQVLDVSKGVYAYDENGEKRYLMGGADKGKVPGKLDVDGQSAGKLYRTAVSEMKARDVAFWEYEAAKISERRAQIEEDNAEAVAAARDDVAAAKKSGDKAATARNAAVANNATQRAKETPSSAVTAEDAKAIAKIREQLKDPVSGDTAGVDNVLADDMEAERVQDELDAAFADVQRRSVKRNAQASVTDNPRFMAWFGDSKMKKKDGSPIVFYHSSDAMFDTFKKGDGSSSGHAASGLGIFTTPFRETSARYGQHTMALYVRMERPYIMKLEEFAGFEDVKQAQARARELQAAGYDGIFVPTDKTTIVFDSSQLKSVDNNGNFSAYDPNIKRSEQKTGETFADAAEAQAYLHKALGPQMKTEFVKDLGHSGEWEESDTGNTIRIALNAGPALLSVAHHEAMHELFSRLTMTSRGDVKEVLLAAAESPIVTRQLERLLAKEPAALKDMRADPEEKLAYMYQFWAAGALNVGPRTENVFQKIAKLLRKMTGMLATHERAEEILQAFHDGRLAEPSAAGRALDEIMARGETSKKAIAKMRPLYEKGYGFVMPSHDVLTDSDNPHAMELANLLYTPTSGSDNVTGYLNSVRSKTAEWTNKLADAVEGLSPEELETAREALSTKKRTSFAPSMQTALKIRRLLNEFHGYMKERGVDIGFREDYFPRVWDFEKIAADPEAFEQMLLTKYPEKVTPEIAKMLTSSMVQLTGVETENRVNEDETKAGYTPYMQAVNSMKLDFIKDEDAQEFLSKDLVGIMSSYLKQGVRRTEYEARMGEGGSKIKDLLAQAHDYELRTLKEEGRTASEADKLANERIARYANAVHAMEGTIGHDKISPKWRKLNSWMIAYQNMRLLPLVLFSSMIDPLGMMVRGGDAGTALKAYQRGVRDVLGTWTGKDTRDGASKMAELLGVIERESLLSSLGYVQESMYMDSRAKRWSDTFFKWNGMEAWNRAMRVQASVAAVDFIKAHAQGVDEHSARWLAELGLKAEDVIIKDGRLALTQEDGLTAAQAQKMQLAVNQWVDGSMLRPNAAIRPSWSSDPRWALLFHLKQFTYAFHKTFLARVKNEYKHGNTAPMVAMLPFVPVMIASDVLRGLIQNGGELPQHMKAWGVGDYLTHGIQRAGFMGIGQFGVDQIDHPLDFAGPVVGQAIDAVTQPVADTLREAIPVASAIKT